MLLPLPRSENGRPQAPMNDTSTPSRLFVHDISDKLLAGCRLAFALPLSASTWRDSAGQFFFATVATLVCALLGSKLAAGAASEFWIWGAMMFCAKLFLWQLITAGIVAVLGCPGRSRAVLTLLLFSAAPVVVTVSLVHQPLLHAGVALPPGHAAVVLPLVWAALLFARISHHTLDRGFVRTTLASGAYFLLLTGLAQGLPGAPMFYHAVAPTAPPLDIERTYYQQPVLVHSQVAQLLPEDPEAIDLYFVSVGAFSAEDVFKRETLGAARVARARLGAAGRTAILLNHRDTIRQYPLANAPNLQRTLRELGKKIDREEDIVFLFLTSHGSETAELAAEFGPLRPNAIHARDLAGAFDAAGIRWRVIVISACYSGSFIDTLAGENTLVITAAAADRASFGCEHKNLWTYFGEAYFADALSDGHDPVAAFSIARAAISQREKNENKESSNPQIALGEGIALQLQRWQAQRANQSSSMNSR